jgi:hypothetical protein
MRPLSPRRAALIAAAKLHHGACVRRPGGVRATLRQTVDSRLLAAGERRLSDAEAAELNIGQPPTLTELAAEWGANRPDARGRRPQEEFGGDFEAYKNWRLAAHHGRASVFGRGA